MFRVATAATSAEASIGFARCSWNPACSARWRSSSRANAVSAAAGIDALPAGHTRGASDQRVAVLARHPDVRQQDIDVLALQQREAIRGRRRRRHGGVVPLQMCRHDVPALLVVIDDQHADALQRWNIARWLPSPALAAFADRSQTATGSGTMNVAPMPSPAL